MKQGEVTEADCRERNVICMIIILLKDLIRQKLSHISEQKGSAGVISGRKEGG